MSTDLEARGIALAGKLAGYGGPSYKKIYLSHLLASAQSFVHAGDASAAAYCFAKVADGLAEYPEATLTEAAMSGASAPGDAQGAPAAEAPMDRVARRWREEALSSTEAVLTRHGRRLSPLEIKSFRDKLDKAKSSGTAASSLPELRRRLYQRVLKAQKIGLAGRRAGHGSGRRTLLTDELPGDGPVGPYNDRFNMHGLLDAIASADPAWVEEFLEVYRDLAGLRGLVGAAAAAKL